MMNEEVEGAILCHSSFLDHYSLFFFIVEEESPIIFNYPAPLRLSVSAVIFP
jgi:hypothetical protein